MRNRFVYIVLVPFLLLAIVVTLFIDGWVESGLEYAGERATNARVEIDGLELSLFPIGLGWERLQVADPGDTWKNLFETGSVRFSMNAGQLLRAKFIIDSIRVDGFVLGAQRSTDGSLGAPPTTVGESSESQPPSFSEQAREATGSQTASTPVFDLGRIRRELNLDSLTNPSNLETYRRIDSLGRQLAAVEQEWQSTLQEVESTKDRVSTIEARVRSLDVGAINSIESAQKAYNDASEAYEGTRDVVGGLEQRKAALTQQVNGFATNMRSIDDAAKRDFDRVVSAAKLPDVSMRGLAELVLGREILDKAYVYLGYVDLVRETIPKYTPKPDPNQPRRSEGVVVHFPQESSYPKFWIREIRLSGGSDTTKHPDLFYAVGTIQNISNDQRVTQKPITIDLTARQGKGARAEVQASFDRREDLPVDRYVVDVSGLVVGDMPLGSSTFLPSKITNAVAHARVSVDVPGSDLESSARVNFSTVQIAFEREPSGAVERLTKDVLAGVRSFFVGIRFWKMNTGALDVAFETDLDAQLSGRARAVIGAEVSRLRNEIRQKVDAQISKKRRELETLYAAKRSEVQSKLSAYEREIREKVTFVEKKKKELEDRIEQEKKKAEDALKKKAGDALKGILRRN